MSARHSLIPTTATAVTTATLTTTASSSSTTFTNFPVNSMLSLPAISATLTLPHINLHPTTFSPLAVSGDTAGDGTNTVPKKLSTAEALGSKNNTQSFQYQQATKVRALNSITSTVKDKNVDFLCPVCFEIINEAHITRCGHTFCYTCIVKAMQTQGRCPKCNLQVMSSDFIFPNYLLSELIAKYKRKLHMKNNLIHRINKHKLNNKTDDNKHNNMNNINNNNNQQGDSSSGVGDGSDVAGYFCDGDDNDEDDDEDHIGLKTFFKNESQKLNLDDVTIMLDILQKRKRILESESNTAQNRLLYDFLKHLLNRKEQQEKQIATEIKIIRKDLTEVTNILKCIDNVSTTSTIPAPPPPPATVQPCSTGVNNEPIINTNNNSNNNNNNDKIDEDIDMRLITSDNIINYIESEKPLLTDSDGFNTIKIGSETLKYLSRKQRMHSHFDDFVKSYFTIRCKDIFLLNNTLNDNQDNIISSDSGITVAASANTAAAATDATTDTAAVDVAAAAATETAAAAGNATATTKTLATDINVNDNSAMIIDGGDCSGDNTNAIKSNKNNDKVFIGGSGDINNNASSSSNNKKPRINHLKLTTNKDNNTNNNSNLKLNERKRGLDLFRDNLVKFSRYSTLRPLATMLYSADLHTSSTIVSTIAFDKDNEFLAVGGVTKRIKIFDYLSVVRDTIQVHYPTVEMLSTSKIACLTWNSYQKNILASSDYEGAVNIWDVQTGQRVKCFHEHEKRCWSVDFNDVDTRLIASGSDDARVKLWSLNNESSIATLEAKANVCCVKFNPKSSCHLAFGSADHDVHYYDLRNMSKALCIFKGHKKAVSYVKFLNSQEIISASTDSQLKLWNINSPPYCLRSFVGHVNEKNFIGLATDNDYIACGSEDNSIFIYYKGLSKRLINYKLDGTHRVTDIAGNLNVTNNHHHNNSNIIINNNSNININSNIGGNNNNNNISSNNNNSNNNNNNSSNNDSNDFVSAVCWRKKSNVVVAANSRGIIKILELV